MTEQQALEQETPGPCLTSIDTLVAHAIDVGITLRTITDAWTESYGAGDCSPHQIIRELYGYHRPLAEAISVLEQAKQRCRHALAKPLRALHAPVEFPGQAILRWVAPTQTASYAPKTIASIATDLQTNLVPLLPSLDTLGTLMPILSAAQERGVLSAADTESLVTTINDLARGCRAAQDAAQRLQDARTEGSRAGYVMVELDRSFPTPASDCSG